MGMGGLHKKMQYCTKRFDRDGKVRVFFKNIKKWKL